MNEFFAQNAEQLVTLAMIVIGLPVVLGCSLEAFRVWTRHREKMVTALNAQAAEKAAQYAAYNERLETRVQVLERIATDRGADLHHQIELLRDERAAH
jgi:hypothetical protein